MLMNFIDNSCMWAHFATNTLVRFGSLQLESNYSGIRWHIVATPVCVLGTLCGIGTRVVTVFPIVNFLVLLVIFVGRE